MIGGVAHHPGWVIQHTFRKIEFRSWDFNNVTYFDGLFKHQVGSATGNTITFNLANFASTNSIELHGEATEIRSSKLSVDTLLIRANTLKITNSTMASTTVATLYNYDFGGSLAITFEKSVFSYQDYSSPWLEFGNGYRRTMVIDDCVMDVGYMFDYDCPDTLEIKHSTYKSEADVLMGCPDVETLKLTNTTFTNLDPSNYRSLFDATSFSSSLELVEVNSTFVLGSFDYISVLIEDSTFRVEAARSGTYLNAYASDVPTSITVRNSSFYAEGSYDIFNIYGPYAVSDYGTAIIMEDVTFQIPNAPGCKGLSVSNNISFVAPVAFDYFCSEYNAYITGGEITVHKEFQSFASPGAPVYIQQGSTLILAPTTTPLIITAGLITDDTSTIVFAPSDPYGTRAYLK
jgi:hypothetical protein